jgi:hypothetical protein
VQQFWHIRAGKDGPFWDNELTKTSRTYKVGTWKGHAMAISPPGKARVTHYIALISGVVIVVLLSPVIVAYLIYVAIALRSKRAA